jgi:hypothetical protein
MRTLAVARSHSSHGGGDPDVSATIDSLNLKGARRS